LDTKAVNLHVEENGMSSDEEKISGKDWIKYSISVWDDCKSKEEKSLNHPASFPVSMVQKLIRIYSKPGEIVLDPFMGVGSTLIAANRLKRLGAGFEINNDYFKVANHLLKNYNLTNYVINESCLNMNTYLHANSVDFCLTSPPYWDILNRKRSADYKQIRNYGDDKNDLGNIKDYQKFLCEIGEVIKGLYMVLKAGRHCIIIVMDIRKKKEFYPLHIDVTNLMQKQGFHLEDYIIWDRRKDYNNLRPLGYPYVFRVNKVHEYICIFKKPGVAI